MIRAGASTRFTSKSICNMYEYESKYEYLIITWVGVRVRVLVDEYEYKNEYRSMVYILYNPQYCIFQSLERESSDSNHAKNTKPQTAHCPCQFFLSIYLFKSPM